MIDAPEDYRYIHPNLTPSPVFRAVSAEDAVAFVRLHFCPDASDMVARSRVQCLWDGQWVRLGDVTEWRKAG